MDWLDDYEDDLRLVFQESKHVISRFPEPLNSQGLTYLEHFDVFNTGSHNNYICYLLPFWFQKGYALTSDDTRKMSMGNLFYMLYFFIQDDLMDSNECNASERLPLANLLYVEFLNIYRPLFPHYSPFWSSFNRYISQWADSVSNENTTDYFLNDRVKIAHKASPLKLSSTSALLLSGHDSLVAHSEGMIDQVLLTLQMLDDFEDWEEDLTNGSYNNCLLSFIRSQLPDKSEDFTSSEVNDFLYTKNGIDTYVEVALSNHLKLETYNLATPHLLSFHHMLVNNLQQISATLQAQQQILQYGGLNYWMSKNIISPNLLQK